MPEPFPESVPAALPALARRRWVISLGAKCAVWFVWFAGPGLPLAHAAGSRCPGHVIVSQADPALTPAELATINGIWHDLGGPASSGGDGPLGCPIGAKQFNEAGWQGVGVPFQHGWILVGRGDRSGSELAVVRGVGGWTVWWKGLPEKLVYDPALMPTIQPPAFPWNARPATWARGGFTVIAKEVGEVALWQCDPQPCKQVTPSLWSFARPLDAAARLDVPMLARPDAGRFAQRLDAVFPEWLPCYTRTPAGEADLGETTLSRAMLMMRRGDACPLTGESPQAQVKQWLAGLTLPPRLPGTSTSNSLCSRSGELDVDLVQLLHLVLAHQTSLGPTVDRMRTLLAPQGGKPRKDPYVTPHGACLGYGMIETENHILLQESARYLINAFVAPLGLGAEYANTANRDWLLRFLQQLVRRDWYEYNSIPYTRYQLKALLALQRFAPDPAVRTSATGVLHWLFAKQALSGNHDRDHRPYRRVPEPKHYAPADWWDTGTSPTVAASALLAGPLQHFHRDVDLLYDDDRVTTGEEAHRDVVQYPELGAASDYFLDSFVDIADSGYVLPQALAGWFDRRFTREESNRLTYVAAINHRSPIADAKELFAQASSGQEVVSGNRNWTMIAGGSAAPPGDPGPPPLQKPQAGVGFVLGGAATGVVVGSGLGSIFGPAGSALGAVIGGLAGLFGGIRSPDEIAADRQHEALWSGQAGMFRETMLIPTAVGLDRAQTLRFARPMITPEGTPPTSRLCVAEGFMCGFDLLMPTRPFPAGDASQCPPIEPRPLPPHLANAADRKVFAGQTIRSLLGCPTKKAGFFQGAWVWTYERGLLVTGSASNPGDEPVAAVWLEEPEHHDNRRLRVSFDFPGPGSDWMRVHAFDHHVEVGGGDVPDDGQAMVLIGLGDKVRDHKGDVVMSLRGVNAATWDVVIVGCNTDPNLFASKKCRTVSWPRMSVNVAMPPKQSFSCAAHAVRSGPQATSQVVGLVLEVGESCARSPYGLFTYIWTAPCVAKAECPEGAQDYGFVVAAPSRGWKWEEFAQGVALATRNLREPSTVTVPISPPVRRRGESWEATSAASTHTVTFRWQPGPGAGVLSDTAAPGLYGGPPSDWPMANGHISAPDVPGASPHLLTSRGDGCIKVNGLPVPGDPDPMGLLIDLRVASAPMVRDMPGSALVAACP